MSDLTPCRLNTKLPFAKIIEYLVCQSKSRVFIGLYCSHFRIMYGFPLILFIFARTILSMSTTPHLSNRKCQFTVLASLLAVLALLCFYQFRQAMLTPWVGDDIEYQYIVGHKYLEFTDSPIESLDDIVDSQQRHYFFVNGRTPVHFVIQLFSSLFGRQAFAFMQTAICMLFLMLAIRLSHLRCGNPLHVLMALALWFIMPSIAITPVLQANYVWAYAFILLFLILWEGRQRRMWPLVCLIAFFAGWMHESLNIGLSVGLFVGLITKSVTDRRKWLLFVCFCLGLSLIILSPAAWMRAEAQQIALSTSLSMAAQSMRVTFICIIVLTAAALLRRFPLKDFLKENIEFVVAAIVMLLFNIIIGVATARQFLGTELCAAVLLLRFVARQGISSAKVRAAVAMVSLVVCLSIATKRIHFVDATRQAYADIVDKAVNAPDGTTVVIDNRVDGKPWPGVNHLYTMEKMLQTTTHRPISLQQAQ